MSKYSPEALAGRFLLLGVSGSIAAYKAAELLRLLKRAGADVQVLTTPDASRFIGLLTLATLSGREVLTEIFPDAADDAWTRHVSLGVKADLLIVAPATAQTLAKLAHGFADSMLTATALAARCPVLLCPAMDHDMYRHPAVQANIARLQVFGHHVMDAEFGELASGLVGHGRLPAPEAILSRVTRLVGRSGQLEGQHALVTAGPTREALDPIRVVTNHSTGTMGFALAAALARRGAQVTLVCGPSPHDTPPGVQRIDVTTALQMREAVLKERAVDVVFMAAAVADYAPECAAPGKLKKKEDVLTLRLRRTPDILAELGAHKGPGQTLVGFAMETDNGLASARKKLADKRLDWIVLNYVNEEGAGFGTGTNRVTLIGSDGSATPLPRMAKRAVAEALLDRILGADSACA